MNKGHLAKLPRRGLFCLPMSAHAAECCVERNSIEKIDHINREIRILELGNLSDLLKSATEFSRDDTKQEQFADTCKPALDRAIPNSEIGQKKQDLTSEIT
ncbi:hypothetical protein [Methylobacterium nodulans]|uniref:hypothetical protein n=1 Tax=Methylobacterium nodulans TaxID=114616 RepID=UPI0012EE4B2E|nr:hypothetical protein [Methylobacterium nodulans]